MTSLSLHNFCTKLKHLEIYAIFSNRLDHTLKKNQYGAQIAYLVFDLSEFKSWNDLFRRGAALEFLN